MATYLELRDLVNNADLNNKVSVAIRVAVLSIADEATSTPGHADRFAWASKALGNSESLIGQVTWLVLVKNKAATVPQIQGATDASIQNNVNQVINLLAGFTA